MNQEVPVPTWNYRELEVDGVRVIHVPSEQGRTEVTLVFGVGQRDETLTTQGSLHALEHLVMDSVRRTPIEINASVDRSLTRFSANGSPGLVADFLVGVCAGLADPPLDRLAAEAKVLAAEGPDAQPSVTTDGRRAPALRFGDPRVMALLGALCISLNALGFTHRSLRAQVTHLLSVAYTGNQMSYDLARLRLNGLIERREHSNTYTLTADGQRVAVFYTKVHDRLLRPLLAANQPPAPVELRTALATLDRHVNQYIDNARLAKAA